MTWERWLTLTESERAPLRSTAGLSPQLIGLEGCRVETVSDMTGEKERFWVGRSSGWQPCHVMLKLITSRGGFSASKHYKSVRVIREKRR